MKKNEHNMLRVGRVPEIDILKGIAIILMVFGHTFPWCREYIYLFHMAVFLMASGYLFNESKLQNSKNLFKFYLNKLKSLYLPYVICHSCFVILNNIFIRINVYTDELQFIELTKGSYYAQHITERFSLVDIIQALIRVFCGMGHTQLGGATWFLIALLIVVVIHGTISYFIRKSKHKKAIWCCVFLIMIIGCVFANDTSLLGGIKKIPCTYTAFLLGILMRQIDVKWIYSKWMIIISFMSLLILSQFGKIELSVAYIENPIFYIICSVLGWILLISISKVLINLSVKTVDLFTYLGRNTIPILTLHLLSFKLITYLYIVIHNKPRCLLASFHVLFGLPQFYCVLYTIIGVAVPLLVNRLFRTIISRRSIFKIRGI